MCAIDKKEEREEEKLKNEQIGRLRDYAWKHFAYHADQRMKCFNFFIILSLAIAGGAGAILTKGSSEYFLFYPLGLLLIVLSELFRRLDRRNQQLVEIARAALGKVEDCEALYGSLSQRIFGFDGLKDISVMRYDDHLKGPGEARLNEELDRRNHDRRRRNDPKLYSHGAIFNDVFNLSSWCGLFLLTWPTLLRVLENLRAG
jgi:hypothetical protein